MAKTKSIRKKRTKARKSPRAIALTASEPKLRRPRQPRTDLTKQSRTSSRARASRQTQLNGVVPIWAPWVILLQQQALLARSFVAMTEAQQQFVKLWPLSWFRLAQVNQR